MKILLVLVTFFGISWALPTAQDGPQFKNIYVDPVIAPPKDLNPRITGGHEATPHSIPYQAYLVFSGTAVTWLCSGSLISSYFILTVAHCLTDATSVLVYLGAHNVGEYEVTQLRVSTNIFIPHENYISTNNSNDIGLIQLLDAVEFNDYISTVDLPSQWEDGDYVGEIGRLSGWGLTAGSGTASPVLLEANSTIMNNVVCNSYYQIVQDSQVCTAGTGGVGTCNGDSGGPLILDDELIGLTSYGATYCPSGYPSVYTRVDSYLSWIYDQITPASK